MYNQKYKSGKGWAGDVHLQWLTVETVGTVKREKAENGALEYNNTCRFSKRKGTKKGS